MMTLLLCNKLIHFFPINMPQLPSPFTLFPPPVLNHLNSIFWNYNNSKFSYPQISHRSEHYGNINNQSQQLIRDYFQVPQDYQIIYLPNEAGFSAVPFNLNKIVENRSIYVVNDAQSEFAYRESLKINAATLKTDHIAKRKELSAAFPSHFYTFYNKLSLSTGKVQEQPQALQSEILVCNLNYCSHFQQINIKNHGIIFFQSGRGFGLTGMTVIIVRKGLIGVQLGTCPDMMCFQKSVTTKSIINTPYTFVPLLFVEYITYCKRESKGLGEVNTNLKRIKKEYIQALQKKTEVFDTQSNGIIVFRVEQGVSVQELGWRFGEIMSIMLQEQNQGKAEQFVNVLFKQSV